MEATMTGDCHFSAAVKCLSRSNCHCFICNTEYGYISTTGLHHQRNDSPPGNPRNVVDQFNEFKTAFILFCKLLNVKDLEEDMMGKYLADWGDNCGENNCYIPCCVQCRDALLAVLELQNLIEMHQTAQREQVKQLKQSFLKFCDDTKSTDLTGMDRALVWVQMRDYLSLRLGPEGNHGDIKNTTEPLKQTNESLQRRTNSGVAVNPVEPVKASSQFHHSLFQQLPLKRKRGRKPKKLTVKEESQYRIVEKTRNEKDWKMKPCSVLLDRASVKNEHEWKTEDNINPDSGRPVRRSKLKAYGVIKQTFAVTSDTEDYEEKNSSSTVPTSTNETHRKRKKTDIINIKQDNITTNEVVAGLDEESRASSPDAFVFSPGAFVSEAESDCPSDLDDECLDPPVIKQKRKHTKTKGLQSAKPKRRRKARSNYFLLIQDYMLLYKFTVVRVLEGNFVCGEQDCGTIVEGTDYHAFGELREHINVHYKSRGYINVCRTCPCCNESFSGGEDFRSHLVISHFVKKSICECCWRPIGWNMRTHLWFHKNEAEKAAALAAGQVDPVEKGRLTRLGSSGDFPCDECEKHFRCKASYLAHKKTHLPKSERKLFECSQCNAKLLSLPALQGHIERLHNPELVSRLRLCPICNRHFNYRDGDRYRNHVRTHKNEKPFVCETCGSGFCSQTSLKRHENVHATERKYQCEFCTESYKHKTSLRRHQLTLHKDLVPAQDPVVVSKFTFGTARSDFIGPRIAFPCEFCDKVFQLRSRMTKHVKLSHPESLLSST